ncbi:hypothetical protein Tco_0864153 [Tanacetum coccineum]
MVKAYQANLPLGLAARAWVLASLLTRHWDVSREWGWVSELDGMFGFVYRVYGQQQGDEFVPQLLIRPLASHYSHPPPPTYPSLAHKVSWPTIRVANLYKGGEKYTGSEGEEEGKRTPHE